MYIYIYVYICIRIYICIINLFIFCYIYIYTYAYIDIYIYVHKGSSGGWYLVGFGKQEAGGCDNGSGQQRLDPPRQRRPVSRRIQTRMLQTTEFRRECRTAEFTRERCPICAGSPTATALIPPDLPCRRCSLCRAIFLALSLFLMLSLYLSLSVFPGGLTTIRKLQPAPSRSICKIRIKRIPTKCQPNYLDETPTKII